MKTKISFIAVLLLMAVLLGSCTNTPDLPQGEEPLPSDSAADTSTDAPADPFELLRTSGEEWISYGLAAYENGKQADNLKAFFSDRANMTYLTLYDHLFTYDKAKSVPVAEALFAFIYDTYGAEAVLDLEKRCAYKDAYLKSLGLEVDYTNAPEVEAFLATMDFSSDATYKYIISFGNVTYYFKDFGAGSPTQYNGFLYYNTTGLSEMIDYLKSNNLSEGFDTERKFDYYMTLDGSGYNKTVYSNGNMYINDSYAALHEAMHAMGVTENKNIWLSEGLCNYFGKSLGFNDQIAASYIQLLTMAKQGYFDEQAAAGKKQYVLYKRVYEDYIGRAEKRTRWIPLISACIRMYMPKRNWMQMHIKRSETYINFSTKQIATQSEVSFPMSRRPRLCFILCIPMVLKRCSARITHRTLRRHSEKGMKN